MACTTRVQKDFPSRTLFTSNSIVVSFFPINKKYLNQHKPTTTTTTTKVYGIWVSRFNYITYIIRVSVVWWRLHVKKYVDGLSSLV